MGEQMRRRTCSLACSRPMASGSPALHMTRTAVAGPAQTPVLLGQTPSQATAGPHSGSAGPEMLVNLATLNKASFIVPEAPVFFCSGVAHGAGALLRQRA